MITTYNTVYAQVRNATDGKLCTSKFFHDRPFSASELRRIGLELATEVTRRWDTFGPKTLSVNLNGLEASRELDASDDVAAAVLELAKSLT